MSPGRVRGDANLLPAVVIEPDRPPLHSVLWLHGLGASGHDFPPIVPELGVDERHAVRWIFPHAPAIPVTINGGMVMPAWYDIRSLEFHARHDESGIRASAEHLTRWIEHENGLGIPCERIVLAGFSQGGAVALHTALRHPRALAGVACLSTYLVLADRIAEEASAANRKVPIFMAHGTLDPMVTIERGSASRDVLRNHGYDVEWHDFPMVHQVCLEEIVELGAWFAERFQSG